MKSSLVLWTLLLPYSLFAKDYVSLEKAIKWLNSNNRCSFSAVRSYVGKTSDDKKILNMLGAKPGDVVPYSNPHRSPILCIFDGGFGVGAARENGCMMGYYLLDKDDYEPFRNTAFENQWKPLKVMLPGKCDANKIQTLLFDYKLGKYEVTSFGGGIVSDNFWIQYDYGIPNLETKVDIVNDVFKIKEQVLKRENDHYSKKKK